MIKPITHQQLVSCFIQSIAQMTRTEFNQTMYVKAPALSAFIDRKTSRSLALSAIDAAIFVFVFACGVPIGLDYVLVMFSYSRLVYHGFILCELIGAVIGVVLSVHAKHSQGVMRSNKLWRCFEAVSPDLCTAIRDGKWAAAEKIFCDPGIKNAIDCLYRGIQVNPKRK